MKFQPHSDQAKFSKPYDLKPTVIPANMVMVVDTREQRPLFTRIPKGLTICSGTLSNGDYSLRGFENEICFERKAADIFSYCSVEHDKTKRKMEQFKKFNFVGLIIEMKESDLFQFQIHTKIHPEVIRAALISFEVRYGVHIFYGNRDTCARWMLDRMVKYYNIIHSV
jgi:ERCC4-type nuclease